jgi:hypothetical protein
LPGQLRGEQILGGHFAAVEPLQLPVLLGLEAREITQGTVDIDCLLFGLRLIDLAFYLILTYQDNFLIFEVCKYIAVITRKN